MKVRFQYSLRLLFVAVTILALFFAWKGPAIVATVKAWWNPPQPEPMQTLDYYEGNDSLATKRIMEAKAAAATTTTESVRSD